MIITRPMKSNPIAEYWDGLKVALADLRIDDEEIAELEKKKQHLELADEQVRMLHARLFSGLIAEFIGDKWLDDRECRILHKIHSCLGKLGYAPGNAPNG